jgi:hypothetical protein
MHHLEQDYPAISDLRTRARCRVPRSIWAFLEGGTGDDQSVQRNLDGLANITSSRSCVVLEHFLGILSHFQ